jgi:protoporphyrin/coproporphyrin ferrochelatase
LTIGVVVMAYGTPASADEVEAYYTHIRRGRPPTAEQLDDLRARYDAIGGLSPLRAITEAQRARLADALGDGYDVRLGYKHAAPFIEDAVASLSANEVERVVGVVLAPHYSRGSIGEYVERLGHPAVESWHDLPEWRAFQAAAVRAALQGMPARTTVLFTAHSLPERVLADDVYPDELLASATAIADEAAIDSTSWSIAWQSAGRTPEPWRGPDVLEVIDDLDTDGVLVCAQGFTADHLEVLYDLDIAARERAGQRGIRFARTAMVNHDASVLAALAERVHSFSR